MNAPSQALTRNPQIEWIKLLSSVSFRPFHVSLHLPLLCECRYAFDREKMLKLGRKKKKRKERKRKSTQTQMPGFELVLLHQQLASRAWNFTTQPRKQKNKIPPISEYYDTITRLTVWKRNTSHAVSNVNKGKKREVNRTNIFCRKN